MRRPRRALLAALAVALMMVSAAIAPSQMTAQAGGHGGAVREATLKVKVVLVGFEEGQIDVDYLKWNATRDKSQLVLVPRQATNVLYKFDYSFVFADEAFEDGLVAFLSRTSEEERRENVHWNWVIFRVADVPFFGARVFGIDATNTYYSAEGVEDWLLENSAGFGGAPSEGYTLIVADLSRRLPSMTGEQFLTLEGPFFGFTPTEVTPHYYRLDSKDPDLGLELKRRYMTSWGGSERLYFVDLSSGPSYRTFQLPLEAAMEMNELDPGSSYGRLWLTQYVSDYVSGFVENLVAPDFVYPLSFADSYNIKILVVDDRTDRSNPDITQTVNEGLIREEVSKILPFARVNVEVKYARLADYPEMTKIIEGAISPATITIPMGTPVIDARPLYNWLSADGEGHIKDFFDVVRSEERYDIPIFAFAFSGERNLGFTFKEWVLDHEEINVDRAIWGVALPDMILVSHSSRDLNRGEEVEPRQPGKGFGFTNTIIHEVGHAIGLMHPFQYDGTEDFVSSVMASYPYVSNFSQFDIDALLRGHVDRLLVQAEALLRDTRYSVVNLPDVATANSLIKSAESKYGQMNYEGALQDARSAYSVALRAHSFAQALPDLLILTGAILGVLLGYYLGRRSRRRQEVGVAPITPSPP